MLSSTIYHTGQEIVGTGTNQALIIMQLEVHLCKQYFFDRFISSLFHWDI